MPGRDGTGPMGTGRGAGRQTGGCYGKSMATYGVTYGYRCHLHRRLRDGSCRSYAATERDVLTAEKEILESRLRLIDKRMNEDSGKSTDQPNG